MHCTQMTYYIHLDSPAMIVKHISTVQDEKSSIGFHK